MAYNPARAWTLPQTNLTLANNNTHFLYVAVPTPEDTPDLPVLFASEAHIEPKETDGWITYKIGILQAVANGKREASMLWGNTRGNSTPQIQSDWNQATGTALDYIKNKPTIPATYTLPTATDLVKGGVKIGARLTMTGDVLSADVQAGGATSYLGLSDTSDTTYTGKDKHVPLSNTATGNLDLTPTEILTGATGTFTTANSKTVTVVAGIIVSIT